MTKRTGRFIALILVLAALSLGVAFFFSWADRRPWAERKADVATIAEQGGVIVAAIADYRASLGRYPDTMEDLVPEYLQSVPTVQMESLRHSEFEYRPASAESAFRGYRLSVLTPRWFLNFDELFYWPEEDYPDTLGRERIERIGKWAYRHE